MTRLAVLAFAAALLAGGAARANGTHLPDVVDVLLAPGDESTVTLETNFGLLHSVAGGPYQWICAETITPYAGLIPFYARNRDGVMLGSVRLPGFGTDPAETLYRSTDDGCTWSVAGGLTGIGISGIEFDPSDPAHVLATAATGGSPANALWTSTDAGATWTKTAIEGDYYLYGATFSAADPLVVWATASNPTDDVALVFRSTNGGAAFSETPFTERPSGLALGSLEIVATSAADPETAWLRTYGLPNRLWITTNGGAAFTEVLAVSGLLDTDVLPDGRAWVATSTSGSFLALDGRSFAPQGSSPNPRGFAHDARGLFSATDPYFDPFALTLSTAGDPSIARGLFHVSEIGGVKPCPTGSTVQTVCEPLYHALQVRLGLALRRVPDPQAHLAEDRHVGGGSSGCACSTGGATASAPAAMLLAAVAAFAARRRRR